jgi:hypothetical protein
LRGRLRGLAAESERLPIAPRAGLPASIIEAVAAIAHPRLDAAEYAALQAGVGWRLSVELIGACTAGAGAVPRRP